MSSPVSFLDALRSRYGAEDDINSYDPSSFLVGDPSRKRNKKWELVGMEKARVKQSRYDRLVDVVLRGHGITVAVKPSELRDGGEVREGEKAVYQDDLAAQRMVSLRELDLSENADLPLAEVAKLIPYFVRLEILQLSDMPALLPTAGLTHAELGGHGVVLASAQLTKLVLNNVGFRSLVQLRRLLDLPQLSELHLDSNGLTALAVCVDADEEAFLSEKGGDEWLAMPSVHTISLAHNRIDDWEALGVALQRAFPNVTRLFLTDNALPNLLLPAEVVAAVAERSLEAAVAAKRDGSGPSSGGAAVTTPTTSTAVTTADSPSLLEEVAPTLATRFAFLRPLTLLCLNENQAITDPLTVDAMRVLCPRLEVFRITYSTLLPRWNDTLSRMYVIAAMPTIQLLNRGQVRPKERLDSEVFYVQRGLAQREHVEAARNAGGDPVAVRAAEAALAGEPAYPLLDVLREKHSRLVLSIYRAGATASSDGTSHMMLDVRLRCENNYKGGTAATQGKSLEEANPFTELRRTLSSSLTVEQLKVLLKVAFQVAVSNQAISYRSGDEGVLDRPVEMDNELQTLGYYGVCNGAIITVRDTSLR